MRRLKYGILGLAITLFAAILIAAANPQIISGNVKVSAAFTETVTAGQINPLTVSPSITSSLTYTNGTSSGQVDTIYAFTLTLSASPTALDLTTITDPAGASVTFARVREIIVQNNDAAAGHDVKVMQGASNGFSMVPSTAVPGWARYGGGIFHTSDPTSTGSGNGFIVDSTHKTIQFDPSSNTVTILVIIAGCSAV